MQRLSLRLHTALVLLGALLLFSLRLTVFEARPTDFSALRVLAGDVPYRDFWTMYAPGSFVTLAGAFRLFGAQLVVSNVLGIATSASSVAVVFRVARLISGPVASTCLSALVTAAYFGTGYADGFTSYPPAFLFILLAVHQVAMRSSQPDARWAIGPGLLLGVAALFKHDVAAYSAVSLGVAIAVVRFRSGMGQALFPLIVLGLTAAVLPLAACVALEALGAGPDAYADLVVFPLGDFRFVRPEYFPLVPHLGATFVETVRDFRGWVICNVPTFGVAAGLLSFRRIRGEVSRTTALLVTFATVVFCFHWWAAHVQINTNAISLAAWGGLLGVAGLQRIDVSRSRAAAAAVGLLGWSAVLVAEPAYLAATQLSSERTWVGLPHLRGIRETAAEAAWMRALATEMEHAAPADAPLLFVSTRNDMNIYAQSVPFWLTDRRPATRHSELHPGITDVEPTQRQMLAQIARGAPPVVVREHRFDDATLDRTKKELRQYVPVGATLLDEWIDAHYEPGMEFHSYELMRLRDSSSRSQLP